MNKIAAGWLGGAAGAIAVTAIHECLRRWYSGAPRLDRLGMEATQKVADATGRGPMEENELYWVSMVGDILSNASYYSAAAIPGSHPVIAGTALGALAGVGAVELPGKIGLSRSPTAGSLSRKLITIGLYSFGGLLSGLVIRRLLNR